MHVTAHPLDRGTFAVAERAAAIFDSPAPRGTLQAWRVGLRATDDELTKPDHTQEDE